MNNDYREYSVTQYSDRGCPVQMGIYGSIGMTYREAIDRMIEGQVEYRSRAGILRITGVDALKSKEQLTLIGSHLKLYSNDETVESRINAIQKSKGTQIDDDGILSLYVRGLVLALANRTTEFSWTMFDKRWEIVQVKGVQGKRWYVIYMKHLAVGIESYSELSVNYILKQLWLSE